MTFMTAAFVFGTPLLFGAGLLRALGIVWRSDRLAYWAWAYLCGSLGTALAIFFWLLCGKPGSAVMLYSLLPVAGGLLLYRLRGKRAAPSARPISSREDWVLYATIILLAVICIDRITHINCFPVTHGDEANIWAAKAKTLFAASGFDAELARQTHLYPFHADYPLLNPLLQSGSFELSGQILHITNRLPVQLFAPAFLLVMAASLRLLVRPALTAVLLTLLFAHGASVAHSGPAASDFMLAFGFITATDAWIRWSRSQDSCWWKLFAVALAFTVWSKNEGVVLALVLCMAIAIGHFTERKKTLPPIGLDWLWLIAPCALIALHRTLNASQGLVNDLFDPRWSSQTFLERLFSGLSERLGTVMEYFVSHTLFAAETSRLLLALFLGLIVCFPRRLLKGEVAVLSLCVVGGLAAYQLVFIATPHSLQWHLDTASSRVTFHLVPAATIGLAAGIARIFAREGGVRRASETHPDLP